MDKYMHPDFHGAMHDIKPNPLNNFFDYCIERPEEYELMQFTGLHDKNGKEIYEGDVVEFENYRDGQQYYKARETIRFDLGMFHIYGEPLRNFQNIEVIGNIYSNPELLNNESTN